jgi:hypothetical protein
MKGIFSKMPNILADALINNIGEYVGPSKAEAKPSGGEKKDFQTKKKLFS